MLSIFSKGLLLTSSYIPLMVIIAILNYEKWIVWFCILLLIILLVLLLGLVLCTVSECNYYELKIESINNISEKTISDYLFVYIFPFITLNFTDWKNIVVFIFLAVFVGYIYISNDKFYINPVLRAIYRYNIYSVNTDDSRIVLISRRKEKDISSSITLPVHRIGTNIYLEKL